MSIEIRQMLIKSQVVQRAADESGTTGTTTAADDTPQPGQGDWRAACRRLIIEVLDEMKER